MFANHHQLISQNLCIMGCVALQTMPLLETKQDSIFEVVIRGRLNTNVQRGSQRCAVKLVVEKLQTSVKGSTC